MKSLIGKKIGMTTLLTSEEVVPVTVIEAGPCFVLERKSKEKDGYTALRIGCGRTKEGRLTKPLSGLLQKAGVEPLRFVRETRSPEESSFEVGEKLTVSIFQEGDRLRVQGVSKGKGFQGVMKRWGFAGGDASHGSMSHRRAGAIGCRTTPGKIFKGKRMAGHMGSKTVTARNLRVVKVIPERNLILVKGSVPGARGEWLFLEEERR